MNKSGFSFLPAVVLTTVVLSSWTGHGAAQEIALSPLQATEVAKGYRADALKLMPVVNDKNDPIGRVQRFHFWQGWQHFRCSFRRRFYRTDRPARRHSLPQPQTGRSVGQHYITGGKSRGAGKTAGFPHRSVNPSLRDLKAYYRGTDRYRGSASRRRRGRGSRPQEPVCASHLFPPDRE